MAFDFPASPSAGQEYTPAGGPTYVWESPRWLVKGGTDYVDVTGDTMTGNLTITKANPLLTLDKAVDTQTSSVLGSINGTTRWTMELASGHGESGLNTGSNFQVKRFDDAGTTNLDAGTAGAAMIINRGTGAATFAGAVTTNGDLKVTKATPEIVVNKAASGQHALVVGKKGDLYRWGISMGNATNEGGSNAGSDFNVLSYNDAGTSLGVPLQIIRSTGILHFGAAYSATGVNAGTTVYAGAVLTSTNTTAASTHHAFYSPTGGGVAGYISTSGAATTYNTSSDANLKEAKGTYDPQEAIRIIREDPVIAFTWKATGEDAMGWLAQKSYAVDPDLATAPPEPTDGTAKPAFGEEGYQPWGIDYGRRTPYLWAALTHALDRIDQLEARLAALEAL